MENGTWKMDNKKRIGIIGKGAWGKALHHVIRQNTERVRLIGRGETVRGDVIIIAVPTNNIHELKAVIEPMEDGQVIINTSKGIEGQTHRLPHEIIEKTFPQCRYYTLIGPGFAGEVMQDMPTIVNLGYGQQKSEAEDLVTLLQTHTFRVQPVEAIHLLELSAALKNIYAIGCGLADGLGYGINTRTLLTVVAIEELQRLFAGLHLGAGIPSTAGTIGDLILTCNSVKSRNFSFGRALATSSVQSALNEAKGVVEGYTSLLAISEWERASGVSLPLARFIMEVVEYDDPETVTSYFIEFITHV
jgi:glycerol-3-phosphate dehydrogenase (NAD(P)+)